MMKLELITGNSESEEEAARLLAVSRQQREGLTLTAEQARTVALAHGDALRRTGRIEWGPSAAEGLLDAFAGSPWLTRENQGQQLADLLALFYDCRAELPDSLPDGWLLERMRQAYDGTCQGCMELMGDCFLLRLPRHLRQGGRPEELSWM